MQISVSARHGQISEATREKVISKVKKLNRFFERLSSIEVTIDLERPETPGVDLRVSAEHKHDFVAAEQGGELFASLDKAVHRIEQQLRKYKEKVQERHRNTAAKSVPERGELGGPA